MLASDVTELLKQLGLAEFIIVGHLMDGKVSQIVAGRQPEGLRSLILLGSAPPTPMSVADNVPQSFEGLYDTREGGETVIGNLKPHRVSHAFLEQIIEDGLKAAYGAKRAWPQQGLIEDVNATTSRIDVPVHIIAGGDDPVETEASLRENCKAVADVTITVSPDVGHIAPIKKPVELAEAIRSPQAAYV
jgi:3-oxoadipate enol-lactonase